MKTYRITYRMELFVLAPDEEAAKRLFEDGDGEEAEYVELVSIEEYDESFGTPKEAIKEEP